MDSSSVLLLKKIDRVLGVIDSGDVLQTGAGASPRVVLYANKNMVDLNGHATDLYRVNGRWYVHNMGSDFFPSDAGRVYKGEWVHVIVDAEHLKACMRTGHVQFKRHENGMCQVNSWVYDELTHTQKETNFHSCTMEPVDDRVFYTLMDTSKRQAKPDVKVVLIRWNTVDEVFAEYE